MIIILRHLWVEVRVEVVLHMFKIVINQFIINKLYLKLIRK
jgi:hypothetical protein